MAAAHRRTGQNLLGGACWHAFTAEASAASCRALADSANRSEELNRGTRTPVLELIGSSTGDLPGTADVARGLCTAILDEGGGLEQVVVALRILGVFSCVLRGRVRRCPCWEDLVRRDGADTARSELVGGSQGQIAA